MICLGGGGGCDPAKPHCQAQRFTLSAESSERGEQRKHSDASLSVSAACGLASYRGREHAELCLISTGPAQSCGVLSDGLQVGSCSWGPGACSQA